MCFLWRFDSWKLMKEMDSQTATDKLFEFE